MDKYQRYINNVIEIDEDTKIIEVIETRINSKHEMVEKKKTAKQERVKTRLF